LLQSIQEDPVKTRWVALVLALTVGCDDEHATTPEIAASGKADNTTPPSALSDRDLAVAALRELGAPRIQGAADRCNECHAITPSGLRQWNRDTKTSLATCFASNHTARQTVDCLRADPQSPTSPFEAVKLGIQAASAHLPKMQQLFRDAFPVGQDGNTDTTWSDQYAAFQAKAGMPQGTYSKMTQRGYDVVFEWYRRNLPQLDQLLAEPPPPSQCVEDLSGLADHIAAMKLEGWAALDAERRLPMFGCDGAQAALDCLGQLPEAQTRPYGASWIHFGKLRVLDELTFQTYFWTRSSPDGRYVGNGNIDGGAVITDLARKADITAAANSDPGFFPDDSGFLFQTSRGAAVCNLSLLARAPAQITFREPECIVSSAIGLYQHAGAALGGDYFVVNGQFRSDFDLTSDPSTPFGASAAFVVTPLVFDGSTYRVLGATKIESPYEGDTAISPSTKLLVSRMAGPSGKQLGYQFRLMTPTKVPTGYSIRAPRVAMLCAQGGKPNFSFDERGLAMHHYVASSDFADLGFASASDPAFAPYLQKGASNIYLVDLQTGARQRVTSMQPGQFALYPHFRADGWIYFLVRDHNTGHEYLVASEAALRLLQ
jgi:hypothetical protein